MASRASAHVDTFVRDRLPPAALWPRMDWSVLPELAYPSRLNAAAELLDRWIESGDGDRIALHHADGPWTYGRLCDTANRIAHVLVDDCGIVPGNRVLLRSPNHPMLVACWFAVLKVGAIAVSTMPLLRPRELAEVIEKANVDVALSAGDVAEDLEGVMASRDSGRVIRFNTGDGPSLERLMADRPPTFETVLTAADDPAIIGFTSGTTGRSKGTVHFHRDLIGVTDTYARQVLRPSEADVFIGSPPLAFTYALGGLVLFPMRVGASAAMLELVTPQLLLEGVQQYGASIVFTSPTGYRAMLPMLGSHDVSSLRKCVSAGETLPAATFDAWQGATGLQLMDGIGSTEMLHMFIASPVDEVKPGSTGRVVPGYQALVVDDEGREVPAGTIGRLAVSGPTGCRYLDDLDNQRKYVQDGWNLTGDAYVVDADGYFWYQSRTDDLIVTSGYNVAGPEVENALLAHAAVAECAVVGVPDEARGHLVKAFVVLAADAEASEALIKELQDHVKSQIAPYKYPRAVEFVAELPKTLTGKVQRFKLRQDDGAAASGVKTYLPEGWPRPSGFAQVTAATGRTVSVAGQVGWNPQTSAFETADFAGQVRQALENVVACLAAAGARPDQITRMTWYITDRQAYLDARKAIGAHYREIIGRHYPAMAVVVVAGLVEEEALVEIEATAVV